MAGAALLQGGARASHQSACRPAFSQAGHSARAGRARYRPRRPAVEQPREDAEHHAGRRAGRDRDQRRGGLQDHAARGAERSRRRKSVAAAHHRGKPKPAAANTVATRRASPRASRQIASTPRAAADRANRSAAASARPRRRRTTVRSWASCAAPPRPFSGFRNGPPASVAGWFSGGCAAPAAGPRAAAELPGFDVVVMLAP